MVVIKRFFLIWFLLKKETGIIVFYNMKAKPTGYHIPLSITYNNRASLIIDPKTNKFSWTGKESFFSYAKSHNMYVMVRCYECDTQMTSQFLIFSPAGFIKPTNLWREIIILHDKSNKYIIDSDLTKNETIIRILALNNTSELKTPFIPHYRFKNKEEFISKIKTYLLFS